MARPAARSTSRWRVSTLSAVAVLAGCGRHPPAPASPPYASAAVLATPRLFAPGVVSTAAPEFGLTFEPDGRTAYFNRASDDREQLTIWVARWTGATWTAEIAPFSGRDRDFDPFVTPDGRRLYFSSERPRPGRAEPARGPGDARPDPHLWYVTRVGATWSEPTPVDGPVGDLPTNFVSATRDGTLYFGTWSHDVASLYRAAPRGASFAAPERIELGGDPTLVRGNPLIAPDGSFLLIYGRPADRSAEPDLYVTRPVVGGGWTTPTRLPPVVNSVHTEFAPAFSPDGRYLFFTSERPGIVTERPAGSNRVPGDIYQIELSAAALAPPPRGG